MNKQEYHQATDLLYEQAKERVRTIKMVEEHNRISIEERKKHVIDEINMCAVEDISNNNDNSIMKERMILLQKLNEAAKNKDLLAVSRISASLKALESQD